jgi:hypothetical protein
LRSQAREVRPLNATLQEDAVQGEKHVALGRESPGERNRVEQLAKRSSGLSIKDAHINFGPGAVGKKLSELSS